MSKADERIVELLKSLTCYSVKELGIMREMYLKDIERVADNGMFEKLKYSGRKCFDFAIRIKMEESGEELKSTIGINADVVDTLVQFPEEERGI